MGNDELREILEEFFTEASESLDAMEADMIQLENASEEGLEMDGEVVDRLFRVLHTLKGGAGFLSLDKMAKVAHAGENLLDEVRSGKVVISKPVIDALLQTNDALRELLDHYKADDDVDALDYFDLVKELERLSGAEISVAEEAAAAAEPVQKTPVLDVKAEEGTPVDTVDDSLVNKELLGEVMGDDSLDPSKDPEAPASSPEPAAVDDSLVNKELLSEVMGDDSLDPTKDTGNDDGPIAAKPIKPASPVAEPAQEPASDMVNKELLAEVMHDEVLDPSHDQDAPEQPEAPSADADEDVAAAPELKRGAPVEERRTEKVAPRRQQEDRRQVGGRRTSDGPQETIRVEVDRLDKVMNLVGELVLARNSLNNHLNHAEVRTALSNMNNGNALQASLEQLSRATKDLQMSVLSTRMQPIKKVFDKIPRQVRELKNQLGKEVDLIIEGEMTEVDKSLVEELSDPMVHMIRNALDHGIETPDKRKASGKHTTGSLFIRAFYEGNNVVVQVQEDGAGIDPEVIKSIAIKKGVITETAALGLTDGDAVRLILAPGFSTAEQVSDVSGRGVGMDVVNSKIMHLKGTLDIKSEKGLGTTFSIYLPLTLAIVQALVVSSNEEGFAIPIGDISEVIKFKPDEIHRMNEQDVIELRGEAMPLFYLSSLTKMGFRPPAVVAPKQQVKAAPKKAAQPVDAPVNMDELSIDDLERVAADTAGLTEDALESVAEQDMQTASKGFIVVVKEGSNTLGLVVDRLLGQEEAVVKPVTDVFDYHNAVSGATITGDGSVHMIIDVPYMLKNLTA